MKPLSMKHAVATIERGERRDIPQTPCPLVQPEPNLVPIPTNTQVITSPNALPWNSMRGNVANRPHSSGASALRQSISLPATSSGFEQSGRVVGKISANYPEFIACPGLNGNARYSNRNLSRLSRAEHKELAARYQVRQSVI